MPESVSLVIASYNCAEFLPRALASCLRQTLPPREIIVVDDGSTDSTGAFCAGFGDPVSYIRVENGGVARARNIGAARARGDFLVFLDADDALLPHALEALRTGLTDPKAGVSYGMVIERAAAPTRSRLNGFNFAEGIPPEPARRNFWRSAIITPGSAMVRRDLHRQIEGFVSGYEPLEDRDYWVKCGLLAPFTFCDTVVLDKTWRAASHGSQHAKRIYRGQMAQRALRSWCRKRGLDAPWIPADSEILARALDEAVWRREKSIVGRLRREAALAGVSHWRSALYSLGKKPPEPGWLEVTPAVVDR